MRPAKTTAKTAPGSGFPTRVPQTGTAQMGSSPSPTMMAWLPPRPIIGSFQNRACQPGTGAMATPPCSTYPPAGSRIPQSPTFSRQTADRWALSTRSRTCPLHQATVCPVARPPTPAVRLRAGKPSRLPNSRVACTRPAARLTPAPSHHPVFSLAASKHHGSTAVRLEAISRQPTAGHPTMPQANPALLLLLLLP